MTHLYLDDVRPVPPGWDGVKTAQECIDALKSKSYTFASLDHDLGACSDCSRKEGETAEEWLIKHNWLAMPNCEHIGTGYTVVCWLEANPEFWPKDGVRVHSANPVGREKMNVVIKRHYGRIFP